MTAVLALAGALIVGGSDFAGGLAARSVPVLRVTAWIQGVSLASVGIAVWFVDAPDVTSTDVVAGVVAGVTGLFSFVALYAAFARGQISLLAPTAAILSGVIPTLVGLARGESVVVLNVVGIVAALVAIALVTQERRTPDTPDHTPPAAFGLAFLAGAGFAVFFLALAETSPDAGLWPLVVARLVSVPVVTALALASTGGLAVVGGPRRLVVWAGLGEAVANTFALWAYQRGPLSVAAVLGAMFPVSTVVLAGLVLHERLRTVQWVGVALALAAVPLVAVP